MGQSDVRLKTGSIHMSESLADTRTTGFPSFSKRKYAFVRFSAALSFSKQEQLMSQGIKFLSSVNGAYFLSFPSGLTFGRFAVPPKSSGAFPGILKLSERLLEDTDSEGRTTIRLLHSGEHDIELLAKSISDAGGEVIDLKMSAYNILTIDIDLRNVIALAEIAPVMWIEYTPEPEEALRYQAVNDERANVLRSDAYGLSGAGITVGVGDAGKVGDHIDLNGHLTNYASYNVHQHATHVSGIIAGKPNLDPSKGSGVAPGATLVTSYFNKIITDTERHMRDHDMLITNNSYGSATGNCDLFGDYDLSSVFIDAQLNDLDTLTHVFAAGNSGGRTCSPFPGRYATILTGWQSAKNTISVGMTTNKDVLAGNSSRGPVDDGRLKPEIVAVGSGVLSTRPGNAFSGPDGGGTSYSSPAIAGITALLYEQYISLHGVRPKSALIKALMLNTADDLGRTGPDYFFGYGRVNARRAAESLQASSYYEGDISQGDSTIFNINVPSGAAELRVMLLWSDPAGAPFVSPALTNDLDMTLSDPSVQSYLPWVLNPSPTGVANVATRGRDSTNNHEQISIIDPQSGSFTVEIRGSDIPVGMQHFVLVYEVVMPDIAVIHPNGYETLQPNSTDVIRWDAYGDAVDTYHVEYSYDGSAWETLSSSVSSSRRFLNWTVPDTFAENSIVRVTAGAYSDSSNHDIVILNTPAGLTATSPCATFAELSWQNVMGADHYRVYRYIDGDMVVIDTTSNTHYTISELEPESTYWLSVSAVTSSQNEGLRAAAKSIIPGINNDCIWQTDISISGILNLNNGRANTSTELSSSHAMQIDIVNAGTDTASGFEVGYMLNNGTPVIEMYSGSIPPGGDTTYAFTTTENLSASGTYRFLAWGNLNGDTFRENDTSDVTVIQVPNTEITLPWIEDFEAATDTTFVTDVFAFCGLEEWDYNLNSGAARMRTRAGSGFILDGTRSITLDETLYNGFAIHDITATINLAAYDTTSDDIRLIFDFLHHEIIQDDNANDMVWIRGSDTSSWISILDLYTVHAMPGEKTQLNSGIGVTNALAINGQNFSSSFQLRFGQEGNASADSPQGEDGYTFDNIQLIAVSNDLKLVSLNEPPVAGCQLADENIAVRVVNTSTQVFDTVPVSYSVNGSTPVTELLTQLLPDADSVFTFNSTYDFSTNGEYIVDVWINHTKDTFHDNDSILGTPIFSFPEISEFPYFEDFENGNKGWVSSGLNNSFELGKPGSESIYKAASGEKAWVTNLTGEYNHDEVSFLTSPCFDLSSLTQPMLSFAHIQELENNYDFLWLEYSDNGGTWTKLGSVGEGTNWYNDAANAAWDNVNTRWHVASIDVPVNSNQVQFRFAFTSDVGLQLEGVGIDAIHIHEKDSVYFGASLSPASQQVSGDDWVHFDSPDGRIFSINPVGQDLGLCDVDMFFHTGVRRDDGQAYVYFRNWVIDAALALVTPVKLRFYITEFDFAMMLNGSGCGGCATPKDAFESELFKFSGITEDSMLTNNTGGVYQYFDLDDRLVMPYANGYAFEIEIADLSEFWITGLRTKSADTLYQSMNSTSDDAGEFVVSGGVNPFSDTLGLIKNYLTGLRFPDVAIPQGAFVREAHLVFTSQTDQTEQSDITIFGEKKDDAASFNTGNYNISQRANTDLHFIWKPDFWVREDAVVTPSLRAIVQEIVDRPGWKPGNAIGFSLKGIGDAQAYSYDADPANAAKLFIIYDSICDLHQRLYVDTDATGDNTGSTWVDGITDLQHALDLSARCAGIDEIWVSEGIYLPAIEEQNRTFRIQNGVALYGGFTGVEISIAQRNPEANLTILSGDLGVKSTNADNTFHVVTVPENSDTATLDGFVIQNGHAFGMSSEDQFGAGVKSTGNILLQNCIIEECRAQLDGSAIYHSGNNMKFFLSNCTLRNNSEAAIKNTGAGFMIISDDNNIKNND